MFSFTEMKDEFVIIKSYRVRRCFTINLLEVTLTLTDSADQHCRCLDNFLLLLLDLRTER